MICGVDFDFLDLPCVNERNINYCNKDLGMSIVCLLDFLYLIEMYCVNRIL